MYKISYFIKRIKRLLLWVPVIWKTHDWDYSFSLTILKYSLNRLKLNMQSSNLDNSDHYINRLDLAINLLDKSENGYYENQWLDDVERKYGKLKLDFKFADLYNSDVYEIQSRHDGLSDDFQDEARKYRRKKMIECINKQRKCDELLWKVISHNIKHWWT